MGNDDGNHVPPVRVYDHHGLGGAGWIKLHHIPGARVQFGDVGGGDERLTEHGQGVSEGGQMKPETGCAATYPGHVTDASLLLHRACAATIRSAVVRRMVAAAMAALSLTACDSITDVLESDPGRSRDNPAAIGQAVEFQTDDLFSASATVRLTLLRTVAGAPALDSIRRWNRFNDDPPTGMEWLLSRFKVEVLDVAGTGAFEMVDVQWDYVTGSGVVYDYESVCCAPEPLDREGFEGAVWEGWIALPVLPSDGGALAVYQQYHNGGAWFRLR